MPGYSSSKAKRFKLTKAAQALARARTVVGKRSSGLTAPVRTGGFYGLYTKRGRDELKVVDTVTASANLTVTAGLVLLNGISQGSDYTNRIGRKVLMKSLYMRFTLLPNSANSAPIGDFVRILLVYDCQTNGAAPLAADILNSAADYLSPLNLANRDRFKVLHDKVVPMNANAYAGAALTVGDPVNKHWKIFKKMNMETIFGGTAATVGSIQTGSIYLLYMSAGATSYTTLTYNCRIRFSDA